MRSIATVACTCKSCAKYLFLIAFIGRAKPYTKVYAAATNDCFSLQHAYVWAQSAAQQAFVQTAIAGDEVFLMNVYLGFAHKKWHKNCSDAFLENDGKDDAAGHIDQHDSHPDTPAVMHVKPSDNSCRLISSQL